MATNSETTTEAGAAEPKARRAAPKARKASPEGVSKKAAHEAVSKEGAALALVHSHMGWAAAASLLPTPMIDLVAIVAVEVNMLHKIADVYGVPFQANVAKSLVASLVGGSGSMLLSSGVMSMLKTVPVLGSLASLTSLPASAAATTWAVGKVFIKHFESGGTFLDFRLAKMRADYDKHFASAKTAAAV